MHSPAGLSSFGIVRLLDRYLLRELLVPLCYCLSGFLLLWIVADLINELGSLQEHKLHVGDIAQYYLVQVPGFLVLGLPIALLLALLYALTNHARHQELTAIRAAGVSLWRLSLPYFVVGLAASLVLLALNELWVPGTADKMEQLKNCRLPPPPGSLTPTKLRNVDFTNERDGRHWHIGVYDTRTGEMLRPGPIITRMNDGSFRQLYAERAERRNGSWIFYDVHEYKDPPHSNAPPVLLLVTNVLAKPDFTETLEEIASEIKIGTLTGISLNRRAKNPDLPIVEILHYLRLHPHPAQASLLYTKLEGRLAMPWTCLVVVLIAIPFGAASGRRNVFVGVAGSILIFFAYYVLQQVSLALGAGGNLPAWLAGWFPNLAFAVTGLVLTARVR
ncbi:MAG TPA: LptF/LptG family permease [Verrucomicrobiae bacterium]|nr:LptF/LptG family permease [Verrucomicrobiae bacterium]